MMVIMIVMVMTMTMMNMKVITMLVMITKGKRKERRIIIIVTVFRIMMFFSLLLFATHVTLLRLEVDTAQQDKREANGRVKKALSEGATKQR